jgi:FPC/CPF motif-containing protein YcgG
VPEKKEVEKAAARNAGPLAEFVSQVQEGHALDGFCVELSGRARYFVEDLGKHVCWFLAKLAELDPAPGENAMKMGPIDQPHWRFRYAGEDFFITTFSPCYPQESSRHCFGSLKAFMLFQPMTSFGRHGLVQDTPASETEWERPKTMRDKARVAFKANGCPYHIPETLPYPVAEHIVKPEVDDGRGRVAWWKHLEDNGGEN